MFPRFARSQWKARRLQARFAAARAGSIAPMAALSAVIVCGAVGGAVDLGQAYSHKLRLQSASDAAALAAAGSYQMDPDKSEASAIARAQAFFASATQNVPGATAAVSVQSATGTIVVDGQAAVQMTFLSLLGIGPITVVSRAEATVSASIGNGNDVEMSLMLDVTGSMSHASGSGGSKLAAMQQSAKNLIDILIPNSGPVHAKVALAPFSRTVNVGDDFVAAVTGLPLTKEVGGNTKYLKRCITERTGSERLTDASPGTGAWLPAYPSPGNPYVDSLSSARNCSPNHIVVPLTSDKGLLKSRVDAFTADGYTAGALGTAWAWYLLSPNWSSVFTGASAPRAYGTANLRKIAVLLTDGTYNTRHGQNHSDGSGEAEAISRQAVDTCANMKAAGIEVFTIGFKLDNQMARDTMRDCATDASYAFLAEDGDQLNIAFTQIAYRAVPLHLSR